MIIACIGHPFNRSLLLSVHGLYELHAVHAVHDKSGENHGKLIPGVSNPKDLQTNPAYTASPIV